MTCHKVPKRVRQRQKGGQDRDEPPLQPARSADAHQLPHQKTEIEAGRVVSIANSTSHTAAKLQL